MVPEATVTLSKDDARALTEEVKADAAALWQKLLALYEGEAHTALGYSSWGKFFEEEFGRSGNLGYKLLKAARVRDSLESVVPGSTDGMTERHARELSPLPSSEQVAIARALVAAGTPLATVSVQELRDFIKRRDPGQFSNKRQKIFVAMKNARHAVGVIDRITDAVEGFTEILRGGDFLGRGDTAATMDEVIAAIDEATREEWATSLHKSARTLRKLARDLERNATNPPREENPA